MADARGAGWRIDGAGASAIARSSLLDAVPAIAHGVTTRRVPPALDWLLRAAGIAGPALAFPRQVHGARVVAAAELAGATVEADGIVLARDGYGAAPAPAVRTADCVPILLAARDGSAVAAVHAGWRGTAAGIAGAAVARLRAWGVRPADILAALGPAIGPCCYEVGEEVVAAVAATGCPRDAIARAGRGARPRLDLHAANRLQLEAAGVPAGAIDPAPWCTRCRNDLFFSARAGDGRGGRLIAAIGPAAAAP